MRPVNRHKDLDRELHEAAREALAREAEEAEREAADAFHAAVLLDEDPIEDYDKDHRHEPEPKYTGDEDWWWAWSK